MSDWSDSARSSVDRGLDVFRRELEDEKQHIEDAVRAAVFETTHDLEAEVERLTEELRIARWDADVPIRELREENERLEKKLTFTQEWYSTRWQRIADELRDTDEWSRVACIMANGTAEATEPPSYAQQMNMLKHDVERLRRDNEQLRQDLRQANRHIDAYLNFRDNT